MPVVQRHRRGFRLRMIRLSPPLDDHTMIALAELLDGVNVLEIFMQGNEVGDAGARALAQATLLCPRLRCVVVSDNQIGELGQRALAEAVAAGRRDRERQRLDRHHLRVVGIGKQRAQLLHFCTGSSRAPASGFASLMGYAGAQHKFTIMEDGDDDYWLPSSATCFNTLRLPNYSSESKMQERLLTALAGSQGAQMED